jgi:transcription termination/antitermination protein NusG
MPAKKLSAAKATKLKTEGQKASATEAKKTAAKSLRKAGGVDATKTKATKAKGPRPKVTGKSIREQESRLTWAPLPVEGARWYVVQSASNYEKRVQTLIREQILLQNLQRFVEDVLIPTEPVIEVKKGQKVSTDRKFFPGYVLIKCLLADEVWHVIRYTPHVTGFLGAEKGKKPFPISEAEAQRILNAMVHGAEKPKNVVQFEVGEEVRVKDGPFANFQGVVESIDEEKERLTVSVSIFGRATPIELDYNQVEK